MATLVIDRTTPMDALLSLMGASRLNVERSADRLVLTPVSEAEAEQDGPEAGYIDPADYPDTTAYLNAIPGLVESIRAMENAPDSEFTPVPRERYCRV